MINDLLYVSPSEIDLAVFVCLYVSMFLLRAIGGKSLQFVATFQMKPLMISMSVCGSRYCMPLSNCGILIDCRSRVHTHRFHFSIFNTNRHPSYCGG